ncbi:MAG TPA: TonB-dependent receptor [Thermoanaerobaculia bacterium]|nr:TonB-dependent receptor [Thermoanaerobaculia bacterium]
MTALVVLAAMAVAGLALGQAQSGNLYGRVIAEDGSALPGVTVTLSGGGPTLITTTDNRGEFHFLNLAPSTGYGLKMELSGFTTVDQKAVSVALGHNTDVRATMKLTKVEAAVTVEGQAPLLDTKKVGTGATVTRNEMDMIPSARDPWVVMQTIPGVQIDRLNVGGNQSGQQSIFVAKGAQTTQGSWNLDGVTVSDMASGASSPTYWDFDAFQELQVVTGGNDPSIATAGVTLNMVTKRGTNDVHGSARVFITDPAFQAHPDLNSEMKKQSAAGNGSFVGSQISGVQDYGIEVGGPVLRDRLWLWGSYGRDQIDLITTTGFPDKTTLEDINGKLNWQVLPSNALTGFYLRGDKRKQGRSAAITRPPETTVDQKGPTALYKIEDNQVISSNLVVDAFYSYLDEGFQLVAEGGDKQVYQDSSSVWHNSFINQYFKRPQHQALGSFNYFFNTGNLGHEIKGGGSWRNTGITSIGSWPGQGLIAFAANSPGDCTVAGVTHQACGAITRDSKGRTEVTYWSAYASDTITADRLTISAGLRYDDQKGTALASNVPANPLYPNILPAANAPERDGIHWQDVSPRFGVTYALGEQRRTLARASYARYANQLGSFPNSALSAIPGVAYAYYPWIDANKNNLIDPGELNTSGAAVRTVNFNPANPTSPVSVNNINPDIKSQKTDEFVIGVGHELFPNFAVDAAYTYRHAKDFYFSYRSDASGAVPSYHFDHNDTATLPNGQTVTVPVYVINGTLPPGVYYTNRPNYTQDFNGVELTLNKRLSGGWMARGSFAYNMAKQNVGSGACPDPNNKLYNSGEDSVPGMCEDGGLLAPNAGGGSGSFGNVNLQARWQFNVSGAYQLPLGFTVAGNFYGREGYPIAYWISDTAVRDGSSRVYATNVDAFRYAWAHQLDLRLDKNIPITSTVSATIAVDMFNVFNDITVTQRNSRLNVSSPVNGTNTIFETQAPRILRFSGRISF